MTPAAKAHVLTSYYIKKYEERYGEKPIVNRNTARWSWENMLHDMTSNEVKELLDYYFASHSAKSHELSNFFYNYDKILLSMRTAVLDLAERKRIMKETEERARKWREKVDKRTQGN